MLFAKKTVIAEYSTCISEVILVSC